MGGGKGGKGSSSGFILDECCEFVEGGFVEYFGAKGGKGGKGGYYSGFGGKGGKGGFGIGFTTGYGSKGGKSYGGFATGEVTGGYGGKGGKGEYYGGFAYGYAYTTEQNTANNEGIAGGYAVESSYEYTLPETSYSYSTTYQDNYVNPGQAQAAFMGSGRKTTQEEETVATDKASSLRGNGE